MNTIQKLTKYIIISEPNWDIWNKEEQLEIKEKINWDKHYKKIHTFPKTYKHRVSKKGPKIYQNNLNKFLEDFDTLSVQRSLKIIGIFSRLFIRDKKT